MLAGAGAGPWAEAAGPCHPPPPGPRPLRAALATRHQGGDTAANIAIICRQYFSRQYNVVLADYYTDVPSPEVRAMSPLSALSRPLPPLSSVRCGSARLGPGERREKICEVSPGLSTGEGDTGGGGHRSGGAIGQTHSQWSSLSKNVEFQE